MKINFLAKTAVGCISIEMRQLKKPIRTMKKSTIKEKKDFKVVEE